MLAIALLAGGGAGRASTDAIRATKDAAALPTWENLYDWAGGHGYVGWHTSTSSTSDYGLAPALGGQPGVWLWPKGGQHVYTPGDYAEWTYTAPGTTRLERTSLSFSYRNKLLAHHCIEIGFRTLVAAAARPESPSTLVAFSGVARSFDADAGRVAWIDSAWVLHVRSVRSDAETTIRYTNPYQEIPSLATGPPLVLEPRQLLWLSTRGVAGFEDADRAYVAPVGATRGRRLTNLVHSEGARAAMSPASRATGRPLRTASSPSTKSRRTGASTRSPAVVSGRSRARYDVGSPACRRRSCWPRPPAAWRSRRSTPASVRTGRRPVPARSRFGTRRRAR
jgi:hypothetical protein